MVVHLKHQTTEVKHMTFKEYYESTGPISLKDAISIIKKIDPEHDITKTYKAESTILKAVIEGKLVSLLQNGITD